MSIHLAGLAAALWVVPLALALPPVENNDGSPQEPCTLVNTATAQPLIALRGQPLTGCSVELTSGGSKIELVTRLCHDPTYYDLPANLSTAWQLISWPGSPAPTFSSSSTLANLSLPRAGTYVVRFTICPSGSCSFRPRLGSTNYPLATASFDLAINAVDSIPIAIEKYPILPPSVLGNTAQPTHIVDKDCKCQGGGGVVDPQWVTVEPWRGPQDYRLLEGSVAKSHVAVHDNFLNHDSHDVNFAVMADPPFRSLISTEPEFEDEHLLGVEWEVGSFPDRFRPLYGDRVSVFGFWILDCGHPPFYSEIHPAVGLAVHRPRPVSIPPGQVFSFAFPDGTVNATAGNNVFVPGILTDLWFNRNPGEVTGNCSDTGLHQPGQCFTCDPPNPNCPPWIGGDCIEGGVPIGRIYEFNIYLPRNPAVVARSQGVTAPTPPLYINVSNPWGFGGPSPVITRVTEGDVTFLHVTLDLRGYTANTYSRRIEAAWVYPATDNWSLSRWHVSVPMLDVHDDQDPWTDFPYDDGDYRLWFSINNRDQEWSKILFGDDNAHGTKNFSPIWQTGASDPTLARNLSEVDSSHRLGPDVLSYPDQGVQFSSTAYESDSIWDDDPGRISTRFLQAGTRTLTSDEGNYSLRVQVTPGPSVGPATLSAAASRLNGLLRIRCNNNPWLPPIRGVFEHPLEVAGYLVPGIADEPPWTVEGELVNAQLGTSVAGVGDVNGDDIPDVLIGGPGTAAVTGAAGTPGRAELYLGYPKGLATAPIWRVTDGGVSNLFGRTLAGAGDVNHDGLADFVIGAPGYSNGQFNEGAAFLWLGTRSTNGPTIAPQWQMEGNFPGAAFGSALASGDFNGDGFSDVIVGAPFYQNSVASVVPLGRVFVYLGSSNGLATTPATTLIPGSIPQTISLHWFGHALAATDVNHDGFADVVVGAPHYTHGQGNEGALFVYMGSAAGLSATPARIMEGGTANAQFGFSVAAAGDVNGDGFSDVIAGSPTYWFDDVRFNEGAASLFLGTAAGLNTNAAWAALGAWGGAQFGTTVAGVGDLNGDGLADVIVGSPLYTSQTNQEGRIHVYLGDAGRAVLTGPTWIKASQLNNAQFGHAVAGIGDFDEDGFDDFVVGAPGVSHDQSSEGAVYLYRGMGPREIRPAHAEFFESVDEEPYALFNVREEGFDKMLIESGQTDPAKLDRMLATLRTKLAAKLLATPAAPDVLAGLKQLEEFLPADLWEKHFGDLPNRTGGALYLDCGATVETIDSLGRRWKPDGPYLVTSNSNVNPFNGQVVTNLALSDRQVPNNVLLSERWFDGDLRYEIPIENGPHTVILYFSENCPACVGPSLGGTGPANAARLFDLDVEGRRINAYNPADAARAPAGDGLGVAFTATQVVFRDVAVSDGILNINVVDRGNGNPPENSAIDAIAVLQIPSETGLAQPHIADIRRVELNLGITVDGQPNLPSSLAGLTTLTLEQSADLSHWSELDAKPFVFGGQLHFEFAPQGGPQFFRVVARNISP